MTAIFVKLCFYVYKMNIHSILTTFVNNFLKFIIKAVTANPGATPLFHSDRGYQYTSKGFNEILVFLHQENSMNKN